MCDSNQTSLFPKTEQERGMERETAFLEGIFSKLKEAAKDRNAKSEDITYKVLAQYSSVKFRSSLICKIKLRGKKWYISFPGRLREVIPKNLKTAAETPEGSSFRIDFHSLPGDEIASLIEKAALLAIELVPKEFDCCSHFEECCDAKVCVHPDPAFSMLCGYRKILKSGYVFWGKNRNID